MRDFSLGLGCLLLAGCVSYESAPIDWDAEAAAFEAGPTSVSLSVSEARLRALAFSPELNALRLAHATSKARADAAGYWEDPTLNLDVLRVLTEPKNPWTYGGSVSFTLPLSGIPGLERRAAEAYSEADRWDVIAAEYDASAEAATLAHTARALQHLIAYLEEDRKSAIYRDARRVSERLVEAGEMTRTEFVQQGLAEKELDQTLFDLRSERLDVETKLRRLTGLPPTCSLSWTGSDPLPEVATNEVSLLDFTHAPRVRAALARYEGKEIDLKKEIRKQYPELSLGPAYTREDGFDKIGFTLGLSLPLWNRNRQGIAEANGARDEGRLAVLTAWQDVVRPFVEARQALALIGEREIKSARPEAQRLYEAGEMSANEFVACLQQDWSQCVNAFRRRLAAIEATCKINVLIESLKEEGTKEE